MFHLAKQVVISVANSCTFCSRFMRVVGKYPPIIILRQVSVKKTIYLSMGCHYSRAPILAKDSSGIHHARVDIR